MDETMMSPGGEFPHDDGRPQLARRNDDIGRLAWRLVGDQNNPPDPTAAPLLLDAMAYDDTLRWTIQRLRDELIRSARDRLVYVENRTPSVRNAMSNWQEGLTRFLTPLLWDFDSAIALTSWAVDRCRAAPPAVETGSVTVNVVWADVGRVGIGERVTLDDGRRGTVVLDTRPDGKSGVALHNETETVGDGMPAQAYASESWPRRRW